MIIRHNLIFSNRDNVTILVPYGMFIHKDILFAQKGDKVELYDGVALFVSACEISINTDLADTLSLGIYGLPISIIMGKMRDNYGDRIWKDRVIVVVVKK